MRILKPIKESKKAKQNIRYKFFTFDVETTKLEPMPKNFVFCVIYGFNTYKVCKSPFEFKKEISKPKYKGSYFFAHNAEFDLTSIFGNIYEYMDNQAIFNGKFISAIYNDITFGDSMNIFPASLKKVGQTLGIEKLENEKIKNQKLTKNNITNTDIEYCKRDCEIIFKALLKIFEQTGTIKLTISSLAMYTFRKDFLTDSILFNDLVDEFYNSYFGGRTEAFKIGKTNATVYDINSLYPFIMKNVLFPDVRNLKKEITPSIEYFLFILRKYEGLAKIKVRHKDTYFGFLPVKAEINKQKKLLFPVGTFETTVNFNEIRFALKHGVIEILKVDYLIYSNPVKSPFINFVDYNYNLRVKTDNLLEKYIYKLKLNSLYGRFALRKKFLTTYYNLIPFDIISELEKTKDFFELKLFNENRNDCFLITENKKFKNSFFSIPTFSSYITSEARIYLLSKMLDNEKNGIVYCDTDSIFLEGQFIGEIGEQLGQFKNEKKNVIEIRGLKNYTYIDENGIKKDVIKGVSINSEKIDTNKFLKIQYYKTKEALRQNKEAGSKKRIIKEISNIYDKRIILKNGNTKPIEL